MSGLSILHRKLTDSLDPELVNDRWNAQEFLKGRGLFRSHHARIFQSGPISTSQVSIAGKACQAVALEVLLTGGRNNGIFKIR